jgi:hypothetical protein
MSQPIILTKKISTLITFTLLANFSSCIPESQTEYNKTIRAPLVGENQALTTLKNQALRIIYNIPLELNENSIDLQITRNKEPLNGKLEDCKLLVNDQFSCLYYPNEDFIGEDYFTLIVKDGDFISKNEAIIMITVLDLPPEIIQNDDTFENFANDEIGDNTIKNENESENEHFSNNNQDSQLPHHPEEIEYEQDQGDEVSQNDPVNQDNQDNQQDDQQDDQMAQEDQISQEDQADQDETSQAVTCDALGSINQNNEINLSNQNGLMAELFDAGGQQLNKIELYQTEEAKINSQLYFNQLYVPTKRFSEGFQTTSGDYLKGKNGEILVEYFSLQFKTILKLPSELESGYYELATLADDGSRVIINPNTENSQTVVEFNGYTSTRFTCAKNLIYIDHDSEIPMIIDYFQGPRTEIAIILMWRKIENHNNGLDFEKDRLCGVSNQFTYFDPRNNSRQGPLYTELLNRSWAPVPANAFFLPEEKTNPCFKD